MKLLELEQRTPEWHDWRKTLLVSASNAGVLMGSPNKSGPQNHMQLRETAKPLVVNARMQKGIDFEPAALEKFNSLSEMDFKPLCVQNQLTDGTIFGSSMDGMYYDSETEAYSIVEIKIPWDGAESWLWKQVAKSNVPEPYFWQLVCQFLTVGKRTTTVHFYVYDTDLDDGYLITFTGEQMLPFANQLSQEMLRFSHNEPQFSEHEMLMLEAEYVVANDRFKRAEKKKDALNEQIKLATAHKESHSSRFLRISEYDRSYFDQDMLRLDHPEIDLKKYKGRQVNKRITAIKGAKERAIRFLVENRGKAENATQDG